MAGNWFDVHDCTVTYGQIGSFSHLIVGPVYSDAVLSNDAIRHHVAERQRIPFDVEQMQRLSTLKVA